MSTVDPSGATMSELNRRITLAERPVGQVASDCFATDEVEIPAPGPREVLVKVGWLSIDPTIRGWMEGFIILDYMSRANEAITSAPPTVCVAFRVGRVSGNATQTGWSVVGW